MSALKHFTILMLTLLLCACGAGGGSSSSSFTSLVRYSELQTDVSIRNTSAITQQVRYTADSTGPEDTITGIGNVTTPGNATVTEEYQAGTVNGSPDTTNDIHELSITSAEGTTISYNHSTDNLEESFFNVQAMDNESDPANNSDDSTYAILYSNPYDVGLDYNSYGIWFKLISATNSGYTYDLGTVSSGVKTDAANVPTSGTASYAGNHIGHYYGALVGVSESEYVVAGTVTMDANFASGEILYSSSVLQVEDDSTATELAGADLETAQDILDASGSLLISGSTFSGRLSPTNPTPVTLSGNVTGQFYGPNAEEAGGVFELQGVDETVPYTYIGAFGATTAPE